LGNRQSLGRWGEEEAARYLAQHGWEITGRNIRTAYGEIDLVARRGEELVFLEVKTRASTSLGPPEIAITPIKRRHMFESASAYLEEHPELDLAWRIDVAAVTRSEAGTVEILYFENAIDGTTT
jgi:putative endonuclease